MPNEVYEVTHAALSALVSSRAATRILGSALEASGANPSTVTVRSMRRLLAGGVRQELSVTLPEPGLTKSLKRIADDLNRLRGEHSTAVQPPADEAAEPLPEELFVEGLFEQATDPGSELDPPLEPFTHGSPHKGVPPTRVTAVKALTEDTVREAVIRFGEIEPVTQVVIVRRTEVLVARGTGIDTARLPNLIYSTRQLLSRAGDLKLFALERAEGILFVFPLGDGAVVVVAKPDVNIGSILAARAALEEAA